MNGLNRSKKRNEMRVTSIKMVITTGIFGEVTWFTGVDLYRFKQYAMRGANSGIKAVYC